MATRVLATVSITGKSAAVEDDDETSVTYATQFSVNKGTTKFDAVTIEDDYHLHPTPLKRQRVVDSSPDSCTDDIDEVEILCSFPRTQRRFFVGECSNSNPDDDTFYIHLRNLFGRKPERRRISRFRVRTFQLFRLHEKIRSLETQHCRSILPEQVLDRWRGALREGLIFSSEGFYCTQYPRK
ncbi:hypothetical protein OROGR_018556 [Orobanche gracilis]